MKDERNAERDKKSGAERIKQMVDRGEKGVWWGGERRRSRILKEWEARLITE